MTRRPWVFAGLASLAAVGVFVAGFVQGRGESDALYTLGTVALLLSPVFIFPPFWLLKKHGEPEGGTYFETSRVVDRGVYGIVRHPQYLGYMLLVLGFTLHSQDPVTLILGVSAIALFYVHAQREERFLVEQLGAKYEVYRRLVPGFNFVVGLYRYVKRR